jgi:hypothetical protein
MVAEELAEGFFVVGDSVFFDQRDEVRGCVTSQGGLGEVRIFGKEVFRLAVKIREVAAAAAGDENFFADFFGALEEHDTAAALSRFDGAQESSGATAEKDYVKIVHPSPFRIGFSSRKLLLATRWPRVYTAGTQSLLQGACEERRKDRTMFIARMVAVL